MDKNKKTKQIKTKNLNNSQKIKEQNSNSDKIEYMNFENNNNNINFFNNIKNLSEIDNEYRKKLDKRMDILMEKIDEKINTKNDYPEINTIINNYKTNSFNNNKEEIINNKNKGITDSKKLEKINENENDNFQNINTKGKKDKCYKEEFEKDNLIETSELNKSAIFPTKVQIICKRDNEINNRLLKRTKFLENEVKYLKFKLNNIQSQKEFLQGVIRNNKNINKSIFDIFLVDYFKNIAVNWKQVCNDLIDELLIDEIHELTEVKLKLRKIERDKEKQEIKTLVENNKIISPIEMEEFLLFNENLYGIKKVIRSVKESERNLCKKYKVKIDKFK